MIKFEDKQKSEGFDYPPAARVHQKKEKEHKGMSIDVCPANGVARPSTRRTGSDAR
jgi:hypothetical protein